MEMKLLFLVFSVLKATLVVHSQSGDKITASNSIVGGQTLVSAGGVFELGFFTPGDTNKKFLGIWFRNISVKTIVWVANRDAPIENTGETLNLTADGNLALFNSTEFIVWSTNTSSTNPMLQLLDNGNLVLTGGSSNSNILWQSFDHPTDTFLSGMKLGFDYRKNLSKYLTSWKSDFDPSSGEYIYRMEAHGLQMSLWKGTTRFFRFGPGAVFSGQPNLPTNDLFQIQFTSNQYELSYGFNVSDATVLGKATLTADGKYQYSTWTKGSNEWKTFLEVPDGQCDQYAICGGNTVCTSSYTFPCQCLKGFVSKQIEKWNMRYSSDGCVRKTALNCSADGFLQLTNLKLPDILNASATNNTADECLGWCLKNCSCTAYAVIGRGGCLTWYGDLFDIRQFEVGGNAMYIRLAVSELGSSGKKNPTKIKLIIVALGMFVLACLSLLLLLKWKRSQGKLKKLHSHRNVDDELELPLFDIRTIRTATGDFSDENVIGCGGFGHVYKGKLENGVAVAVKRLSKDSHQGIDEFKTEVQLIAKLQHKNLVRLLGCCAEGEERILVYEYMQNKSLDAFIFDKMKGGMLDWKKRLEIIKGIARGLLYLHHDSRLKIIHRDLKTSNILLDKEMNPKISDFGTARIFKVDQNAANTKRIVGTYGYMAPEYVMKGLFSEKSDVFSFGVIVLEILSGKKSRTTIEYEPHKNLIQQATGLWREGKCLELIDEAIEESYPKSKVQRFIHVALLCVQEESDNRPTMENVVLMLSSEDIMLAEPRSNVLHATNNFERNWSSRNEISVTVLQGR